MEPTNAPPRYRAPYARRPDSPDPRRLRHTAAVLPSYEPIPTASEFPVIALSDARKSYGSGTAQVDALKGVNFEAWPNRLTALVGPSGSGKSTLLNLLGGLDTPTSGEVWLGDRPLTGMSESDRTRFRARNIGFVFQFLNLLPGLTCAQNVMLGGVIVGMPPREARDRAVHLLEIVGLGDKTGTIARQLSGGQMQRVAIARALINDAPLLLADEPTGNLDERNAEEIIALLHGRATDGRAVVLVTHNNDLAERYADECFTVRDGHILRNSEAGPTVDDDTITAIEVGPVEDPKALVALQRAIEDCLGGGARAKLSSIERRMAIFEIPATARAAVVGPLALHLSGQNGGGVYLREEPGHRAAFELKRR